MHDMYNFNLSLELNEYNSEGFMYLEKYELKGL